MIFVKEKILIYEQKEGISYKSFFFLSAKHF